MGHFVSLKLVVLFWIEAVVIPNLIMTQSTCIKLSLTDRIWALQLTLPQIVFASKVLFVKQVIIDHILNFLLLTFSTLTAVLVAWWSYYFRLLLNFLLKGGDLRLAICLHLWLLLGIRLRVVGLGLIWKVSITPRLHDNVISKKWLFVKPLKLFKLFRI